MEVEIRHVVLAHRIADALVTADNGSRHRVGHHPAEGWFCTCPAAKHCIHIDVIKSVTIPMEGPEIKPTVSYEEMPDD